MSRYYVRIKPEFNGMNNVHRLGCPFMPEQKNRILLGNFSDCRVVMREAGKYFPNVNGYFFCNKEGNISRYDAINEMIFHLCTDVN